MMSSVHGFFEGLSDPQKDLFVSVATDLQASAPEDKIERLRSFHGQLKNEIDSINKRRQGLGAVLNNVESLMKILEKKIEEDGQDLELAMFMGALQKVSADLKAEIAALKPEKKLAKKFDVARRMESLRQRQILSTKLFSDVLHEKDPETEPEEVRKD
jgi:hypothetical protein